MGRNQKTHQTVSAYAKANKISLDGVYKLLKRGSLPGATKESGRWLIPISAVPDHTEEVGSKYDDLGPEELQIEKLRLDCKARDLELGIKQGRLLEGSEVASTLTSMATTAVAALQSLPMSLTDSIALDLGVTTHEGKHAIRERLGAAVNEIQRNYVRGLQNLARG